ncbi:MAG: hypothetical protein HQM00_08560 [Magnetococcales bacterium]|nr:hypothetical protein [Magnetococcales bacterium]
MIESSFSDIKNDNFNEIRFAAYSYLKFDDAESLCKLIETGNTALWENDNVRHLIAEGLRGKLSGRGRGQRTKTILQTNRRNDYILWSLTFLKSYGVPIWNSAASKSVNACFMVSKAISHKDFKEKEYPTISGEAIYRQIWRNHKPVTWDDITVRDGNEMADEFNKYSNKNDDESKGYIKALEDAIHQALLSGKVIWQIDLNKLKNDYFRKIRY